MRALLVLWNVVMGDTYALSEPKDGPIFWTIGQILITIVEDYHTYLLRRPNQNYKHYIFLQTFIPIIISFLMLGKRCYYYITNKSLVLAVLSSNTIGWIIKMFFKKKKNIKLWFSIIGRLFDGKITPTNKQNSFLVFVLWSSSVACRFWNAHAQTQYWHLYFLITQLY